MRYLPLILLILTGIFFGFTSLSAPDPAGVMNKLVGQWKLTFIEKEGTKQDVTSSGYLWEFLPDNKLKHKSGDSPENTLKFTIGQDTLKIDSVPQGVFNTVVTEDGRKYFIKKVNKKQLILIREDTKATTIFVRLKK